MRHKVKRLICPQTNLADQFSIPQRGDFGSVRPTLSGGASSLIVVGRSRECEQGEVKMRGMLNVAIAGVIAGLAACGTGRDFAKGVPDAGNGDIRSLEPAATTAEGLPEAGTERGNGSEATAEQESTLDDDLMTGACGPGTHSCGEQCFSNYEIASCGTSCEPCPVPTGGTASCDGTACGGVCPEGQQYCAGACISVSASCDGSCPVGTHECEGTCRDDASTGSCGSSCAPCPAPAQGTATCDGTSCGFTCSDGYHACDGLCVSNADVATCGLSCAACPVPVGGSATCDGTSCGGSCPVGSKLCAGTCIPEAQSCQGVCPAGTHDCNGTCQPDTSVNSCGDRCAPCTPPGGSGSATCNGTTCGVTCNGNSRLCGTSCLPNNSAQACGANCTVCPAPAGGTATCNNGTCGMTCPQGTNLCGTACIQNSPASCGSACRQCPAPTGSGSATCVNGTCGLACNNLFHRCGDACVSNNSINSCGSSCSACRPPNSDGVASCNGTACGVECDDGFLPRSGNCVRVPVQVAAGGLTSCALFSDGTVECWGSAFNGELGTRASENSSTTPVQVANLPRVRELSVGDGGICALIDEDGSVRCWGTNARGALGNGSAVATSAIPVAVTGITGATAISTSGIHACAVMNDGSIRCWGTNEYGALGNGTSGGEARTPVTVANLGGSAVSVAAGSLGFKTCTVLTNGSVRCWGLRGGSQGILGDGVLGARGAILTTPVTVTGITDAVSVDVKVDTACALLSAGGVRCWGENSVGALGDGVSNQALAPVAVTGLTGARAVAIQNFTGCAITGAGGVQCWGGNAGGSLGNGSADENTPSLTRVNVVGLTGVRDLSAGSSHACAVAGDDTVRCWGNANFGQLGNGTFDDSAIPISVAFQ